MLEKYKQETRYRRKQKRARETKLLFAVFQCSYVVKALKTQHALFFRGRDHVPVTFFKLEFCLCTSLFQYRLKHLSLPQLWIPKNKQQQLQIYVSNKSITSICCWSNLPKLCGSWDLVLKHKCTSTCLLGSEFSSIPGTVWLIRLCGARLIPTENFWSAKVELISSLCTCEWLLGTFQQSTSYPGAAVVFLNGWPLCLPNKPFPA